jgi:hypothetical protein
MTCLRLITVTFGCVAQLDSVEFELGRGARHCQFAEAGKDFADAGGVVVEGGPLFSERIERRVVVFGTGARAPNRLLSCNPRCVPAARCERPRR